MDCETWGYIKFLGGLRREDFGASSERVWIHVGTGNSGAVIPLAGPLACEAPHQSLSINQSGFLGGIASCNGDQTCFVLDRSWRFGGTVGLFNGETQTDKLLVEYVSE